MHSNSAYAVIAELRYPNLELVGRHCFQLTESHGGLRASRAAINDGSLALRFDGKIAYGSSFISIAIWVPSGYPTNAPIVYIVQEEGSILNGYHPNIYTSNGIYNFEWKHTCSLLNLVNDMVKSFVETPPTIKAPTKADMIPYDQQRRIKDYSAYQKHLDWEYQKSQIVDASQLRNKLHKYLSEKAVCLQSYTKVEVHNNLSQLEYQSPKVSESCTKLKEAEKVENDLRREISESKLHIEQCLKWISDQQNMLKDVIGEKSDLQSQLHELTIDLEVNRDLAGLYERLLAHKVLSPDEYVAKVKATASERFNIQALINKIKHQIQTRFAPPPAPVPMAI